MCKATVPSQAINANTATEEMQPTFSVNYACSGTSAHRPAGPSAQFRPDMCHTVQCRQVKAEKTAHQKEQLQLLDDQTLQSHYESLAANGDLATLEKEVKWDLKTKVAGAYRYRTEVAVRAAARAAIHTGGTPADEGKSSLKQQKRFCVMARVLKDIDVVFHPQNAPKDGSGPLGVFLGTNKQFDAMLFWSTPKP